MAFMNIDYQLLIHEDKSDRNPKIRLPDISNSIESALVSQDKSDRIVLYPNEIKTVSTTQRSLSWDVTTELSLVRPYIDQDLFRLQWTGTGLNPAFRTKRNIGGDATTTISITRLTDYVKRIQNVSGTTWSLGSVQVGDFIKFEKTTQAFTSPLSETNQGLTLQVQAKGSDYIDFVDNSIASIESNVVLGSDYASVLKVFTSFPVRKGDTLSINSPANLSNQGRYIITDVSPDYVEFIAPLGVEETFLYTLSSVVIYDYLIGMVHIRGTDSFQMKFGSQAEWFDVAKVKTQSVFLASVSTFEVQAKNDGNIPVELSIQTAKLD